MRAQSLRMTRSNISVSAQHALGLRLGQFPGLCQSAPCVRRSLLCPPRRGCIAGKLETSQLVIELKEHVAAFNAVAGIDQQV
jgi:hypothetical protein